MYTRPACVPIFLLLVLLLLLLLLLLSVTHLKRHPIRLQLGCGVNHCCAQHTGAPNCHHTGTMSQASQTTCFERPQLPRNLA